MSLATWIRGLRKKARRTYFTGQVPQDTVQEVPSQNSWTVNYASTGEMNEKGERPVDSRLVKKPVEVVGEILSEAPALDLTDLNKQIKVVERRMRILEEQDLSCPDEKRALAYLNARKNYAKVKHLFRWQVTNDSLMEKMCRTYKVRVVPFSAYYKNVPMEAIDEIEKFVHACDKIKVKPIFSLVIDDGGKETKKDPILLAASPFGNWSYVLGAWDKEVEIVDKLIYGRG